MAELETSLITDFIRFIRPYKEYDGRLSSERITQRKITC
jgi:hypothetical protein